MRWFFVFNLIHSPDCEECHDLHYGECPVHGPLQIIEDKTVEESIRESAAMASTQPILKSLLTEIEELKEKKRRTSVDIDGLIKSVDNLAEKAELTGNISFVTQSNSL